MIEITFLIPVVRDGNKQPHCPTLWDAFATDLLMTFGGVTRLAECEGCWRDGDGQAIKDVSRRYKIAVEAQREQEVYALLRRWRPQFDQQCIYAAVTSENAYLIS